MIVIGQYDILKFQVVFAVCAYVCVKVCMCQISMYWFSTTVKALLLQYKKYHERHVGERLTQHLALVYLTQGHAAIFYVLNERGSAITSCVF